jgi:ABC-2 type transport system ATP-binding protein
MIVARSISKRFRQTQAVSDLSFELAPGQIAGLLGPNGAGKSTTIRMITGFLCPDQGSVTIGGHDTITSPLQARSLIGYLPESAPSYPEMRAIDYIRYRARLCGLSGRSASGAARSAADRCRIGSMLTRRISTLSKGYKQRVGLAAALVHNPPVLILDEPTNGLDPTQIREARSLIRELAADRTMLVSSHILPEIERTCDRVLVVVAGRLCADGSPEALSHRGKARIALEFRASDPAHVLERIGTLAGFESLSHTSTPDGWTHCTAEAPSIDVRNTLARTLLDSAAEVRLLNIDRPTLEDVFVELAERASVGEARP